MPKLVRIKVGLRHMSGRLKGGDLHTASDQELASFGDKFDVMTGEQACSQLGAAEMLKYLKEGVLDPGEVFDVESVGKERKTVLACCQELLGEWHG